LAPLYLASPHWERSYHPLDYLARLMMLPVYGHSGMITRIRYELRVTSVMLAIVASFELATWYLVFRQFSSGTARDTAIATGAAVLVSLAMTLLERSILVANFDVKGAERVWVWIKVLSRLAIIIFAAARITSQPVKLFAFHSSIEQRMLQEDIRRNLVSAATTATLNLRELQKRFDTLANLDAEPNSRDPRAVILRSQRDIGAAQVKIKQQSSLIGDTSTSIKSTNRDLQEARRQREAANSDLQRLSGRPETDVELRNANKRYTQENQEVLRLEKELRRMNATIDGAKKEIQRLDTTKSHNEFILQEATGNNPSTAPVLPTYQEFDAQLDNFRNYAAILLRAKVPADIPPQVPFVRKNYTDVEQLVIVQDFIEGRPPFEEKLANGLPGTNTAGTEAAPGENARLFDQEAAGVVQTFDQSSAQLHIQGVEDARRMQIIAIGKYWMILGIAIVIPMVALIYKVTAGKELKNYYSVRFQAGSFNPEALLQITTEEFLKEDAAGES